MAGYIQIPHDTLQQILQQPFTARQLKVFFGLYRMLNGYGKDADTISSGQLADYLGLARQHVGTTLKELEVNGYITRQNIGRRALQISINWPNIRTSTVTNPVTSDVTNLVTPTVTKSVTQEKARVTNLGSSCNQVSDASVTNLGHTKEKRNIPKKEDHSLLGIDPRVKGREKFLAELIEDYGYKTVEKAWKQVPTHATSPLPYLKTILQKQSQREPINGHEPKPRESLIARSRRKTNEAIASLHAQTLAGDD